MKWTEILPSVITKFAFAGCVSLKETTLPSSLITRNEEIFKCNITILLSSCNLNYKFLIHGNIHYFIIKKQDLKYYKLLEWWMISKSWKVLYNIFALHWIKWRNQNEIQFNIIKTLQNFN